jgi:hypothetical protein
MATADTRPAGHTRPHAVRGRARSRPPAPAGRPPRTQGAPTGRGAPAGARARVLTAYQAQLAAGQTPTGAALARAAGVSERYGQRLLAEFTADPTLADRPNGDGRATGRVLRDIP